ncbi:hypothetical protein BGZ52_006124, partial [Haplosporangium bisporale]
MSNSYLMEPSESHHPDQATLTPPTPHPDTNSHSHNHNHNHSLNHHHNNNFNSNTPLPSASGPDSTMPLHPQQAAPRVKPAKAHVPSACINCKKAHLACD